MGEKVIFTSRHVVSHEDSGTSRRKHPMQENVHYELDFMGPSYKPACASPMRAMRVVWQLDATVKRVRQSLKYFLRAPKMCDSIGGDSSLI